MFAIFGFLEIQPVQQSFGDIRVKDEESPKKGEGEEPSGQRAPRRSARTRDTRPPVQIAPDKGPALETPPVEEALRKAPAPESAPRGTPSLGVEGTPRDKGSPYDHLPRKAAGTLSVQRAPMRSASTRDTTGPDSARESASTGDSTDRGSATESASTGASAKRDTESVSGGNTDG